jgi:ubiquinone/menaquinone biosynthesis C-methylase UbiE
METTDLIAREKRPARVGVEEALRSMGDAPYVTRYHTMRQTMAPLAHLYRGRHVLDYGSGRGLSSVVLMELGAARVTGVELFENLVVEGREFLAATGFDDRVTLECVKDTRQLPFQDGVFGTVLCNAVFEHTPQPRGAWIREVWRVVAPGGALVVNETPNKYLPVDFHTLHLPLTNWMPSRVAHWIGVKTGRFDPKRTDWEYSGWRGLGYYEFIGFLSRPYTVEHEVTKLRHRALRSIGLPSNLFDPYPCYVVRKG